MKKVERCAGICSHAGRDESVRMLMIGGRIAIGTTRGAHSPRPGHANATMKVARYKARGATQRRGMAAMSVEINVVTLNVRLDGIAASRIHRSRTVFETGDATDVRCSGLTLVAERLARIPQRAIRQRTTPYPIV